MKNLIYILSLVFLISSCSSIDKLIEKGKYDKAFSLAIKKLSGKKNKKTKHVKGLETAFQKLNKRDLKHISNIIAKEDSKYWKEVFKIYDIIDRRQESLEPILPLISKDGYRAQFDFIKKGFLLTEHVKGLESSFRKLNSSDLNHASNLIEKDNPKVWDEVFEIYRYIDKRQRFLELKLPLRSADGYKATFKFIKTGNLEKEAAKNAAAFLYNSGLQKMKLARKSSKQDAISAYNIFNKIDKYYDNYKDTDKLMNEAYDLGQTKVLVTFENNSSSILPVRFEKNLFSFGVRKLDTRWRKFYNKGDNEKNIDIVAVYSIKYIETSPEREVVNHIQETKEVSDGWDYVLDRNGNVMKDTSGNDIKVERFKTISADVAHVIMEKSIGIDGHLIIKDLNSNQSMLNKMISGEAVFDEHFSTFRGNKHALSKETKRKIRNHPIHFPSDEELLLITADELKGELNRELRRFFR